VSDEYRALTFYANIGKRATRYKRNEPTLEGITRDGPSKAQKVIGAVRVEIRVPVSWLDRDGAPVFPVSLTLSGDPRSTEGVIVDLLEDVVPPLVVNVPAQEPVGEGAL